VNASIVHQRIENDAGRDDYQQDVVVVHHIAAAIRRWRQLIIEIVRHRFPIEVIWERIADRPAAIRAMPAAVRPPIVIAVEVAPDDARIAKVEIAAIADLAPIAIARTVEVTVPAAITVIAMIVAAMIVAPIAVAPGAIIVVRPIAAVTSIVVIT